MNQLSRSAFDKAAEYIVTRARPLERTQFEYHFGSGSVAAVLVELKKFQNDDGGFGHGVEPDVRMPISSPIVSSVAFQVLRELKVPGDHQMVRDGLAYFERSFDSSICGWDPVSPSVDEYPHAPWWNYVAVEDQLDPLKRSNPGAEIAGYLHLYAEQVDEGFVEEVTSGILDTFDSLADDLEFHAMMCFMRMTEMVPSVVAEQLLPKLLRGVHLVVGKNAEDWNSYGGRPLWFAGKPESLLASELAKPIQAELDFLIDTQSADGSWMPNWVWGQYEAEWEVAKVEWSGYLTLRNLLALKAWGRV